ncbi:MAG: glycosyltransferase family 25 protein, partial [Planctomycetaceae bacterium]|nr:glycosyltransferase family 25 protein [Planctomycetaceae bacterium]
MIHLARAEGRRAQVEKLLHGTPYPARVLAAVDGAKVPIAERNSAISSKPLFAPSYPFPLGSGEYGCFQSHRKAWQTILDEG